MQAIMKCLFLLLLAAPVSQASPFTIAVSDPSRNLSFPSTSISCSRTAFTPPTPIATLSTPTKAGCGHNATLSSTARDVKVTPAPTGGIFFEPGSELNAAATEAKFRQTTYYSCVTWPTTVHCGWHEPILDASMDSGAWSHYDSRRAAVWVAVIAGAAISFVHGV